MKTVQKVSIQTVSSIRVVKYKLHVRKLLVHYYRGAEIL